MTRAPMRRFGHNKQTFVLVFEKSFSASPFKFINGTANYNTSVKVFQNLLNSKPMQKVILYYKFTPVADPAMTMRWQRELCNRLSLKGRIIISKHGINGTLGGLGDYKVRVA